MLGTEDIFFVLSRGPSHLACLLQHKETASHSKSNWHNKSTRGSKTITLRVWNSRTSSVAVLFIPTGAWHGDKGQSQSVLKPQIFQMEWKSYIALLYATLVYSAKSVGSLDLLEKWFSLTAEHLWRTEYNHLTSWDMRWDMYDYASSRSIKKR